MNIIFRLLQMLIKIFVTDDGEQVTVDGEKIYIRGGEDREIIVFSMYPTNYVEVI